MITNKRNGEIFLHNNNDDEEFQIKKKIRLLSMDTAETFPRDESFSGLTPQKESSLNSIQSQEHSKLELNNEFSFSSPIEPVKKNHFPSTNIHINSQLLKNYINELSSYEDNFTTIKYNNYKYKVNTNLMVNDEMKNILICKLNRIIRPKQLDSRRILAFLEVQWYHQKKDLPKKFSNIFRHLSEYELFLSTQKDFIFVDSISEPCKILSFEEYDQLTTTPLNTFFSRATYDIIKKKIEPPLDQWKKHCICKSPMNPDLLYVQCDKCSGWYHIECIGVSKEEVEAIEKYFCALCKSPMNLPLDEANLKKKGKKSNNKSSKQSASQSLLKYFKPSKDNSSPVSLQFEGTNSNKLGFFNHLQKWNEPLFIGETQNSIFSQTTNTANKSDNLSQISDNLSHVSHATVKTPTKETETIYQEDKVVNTVENHLQEESYNFEEKLDFEPHFPKIELNLEIQSNWTKGFEDSINNNTFQGDPIQNNENIIQEPIIADI